MITATKKRVKYFKIILLFSFFCLVSCTSTRLSRFNAELNDGLLANSFHGLVVLDAGSKKIMYNTNGDRYFTPASNVKIFTLYTGIHSLPDRIPSLKYFSRNDTIYIEGTGNPSWFHPSLKDSTAFKFLSGFQNIGLHLQNSSEERYGPGWAWEDFDTYFSPEKNTMPLYGNVVTVYDVDGPQIYPKAFGDSISFESNGNLRDEYRNRFYLNGRRLDTLTIPFRTSESLTQKLLSDALGKKVHIINSFPGKEKKTLYGMETDSIYKLMMHESDNFLAEQLLMVTSSTLSDTLGTRKAIKHMLENDLSVLKHPPRWVDGSGLSRYNLFTPESMVYVLQRLYTKLPEERLFKLFPLWDASGTVEKWTYSQTPPFIYAKSGSLGNNYNLSGYLRTKSGRVLIFSIMNNHFKVPSSEIKRMVFELLLQLYHKH